MIKDNNELVQYLNQRRLIVTQDKKEVSNICLYLEDSYNIPVSLTYDLLIGKKSLEEVNRFILFTLFNGISARKDVEDFFTKEEIDVYSTEKYYVENISLPLVFDMIAVADDQWIGMIESKTLLQLHNAQMINYNANTQRVLKTIIRGETVRFKITVDKKATKAIAKSMHNNTYIPTTITLNIPEKSEYYYADNKLIITKIESFDILDGFHRLIAISNEWNMNRDFNYPMELRIVAFQENKAKQFIFQEDQKTKMSKIDSKSFNQNDAGNIVINKLNSDSSFNLMGNINNVGGLINASELSVLISQLYFKEKLTQAKQRVKIIEVAKQLKDKFNYISEHDQKYLQERYDYRDLACLIYLFANDIPKEKYFELLPLMKDGISNLKRGNIITDRGLTRKANNVFNNITKGV